jgi:glycosyltransferase involved in cell wall biosynthesis
MPEAAGDAAILIDPYDEPSICNAMRRIIDQPDLRRTLIREGRAHAGRFGWDAYAQTVLSAFEALASR